MAERVSVDEGDDNTDQLNNQDTANTESSKEAVVANVESGKEVSGESKVDSKPGGDADKSGGDDGAPPESDGASKLG